MSERRRTSTLLLEYKLAITPPKPDAASLGILYPWANNSLSVIIQQLFQLAQNSGFTGTIQEFKNHFGSFLSNRSVIFDIFDNFPDIGEQQKLYFDLNDKILYYWDNEYIPVNAMLIANTVIEGGEA